MDGWMEGWMDGQTDREIDRLKYIERMMKLMMCGRKDKQRDR